MKACFAIMPFRDDFKEIEEIIRASAKDCGLEYIPGDLSRRPGSVMLQILNDIGRAAVVVADITGHNPNVFYELGIAHQIKGPEKVVIITQQIDDKKVFDIHQYQQLEYKHNPEGRAELRIELPRIIQKALEYDANQQFWNVIPGRLPRTRSIIHSLNGLINDHRPKGLKGVTIRIVAGLSSMAISNHETSDPLAEVGYLPALLTERNTLRKALLQGASLKVVLHPPRRFTEKNQRRLSVRYERLIGLLNGVSDILDEKTGHEDLKSIKHCEFAITSVPTPNLFIIGDKLAYEGLKRDGSAGFEMTHCETSSDEVKNLVKKFDGFFDESRKEMLRIYPGKRVADVLRDFYNEAISEGNV